MKYNFDHLANRKNTNCVKYDAHQSSLPMWVADMDFMMAPKIKEAIQKDLDIGAIGYSIIPDVFYDSFANLYSRRYGTTFTKEHLIYVSGVVASIDSMLKEMCQKGDKVLMLSPIYHTFYSCIKGCGLEVVTSEMIEKDNHYEVDYFDFENKIKDPRVKVFLLCNPHNPVGKIFSEEELLKLEELADKYNTYIISDEIHGLLTNPDKKYVPFDKVAKKDNYSVCLATSKAFNLAGLQSSVLLCRNKEYRDRFQAAFYRDDIGEPNYFAVNANIAALRDSEDWLDEVNEYVYQNKVAFVDYLNKNIPEIKCYVNDATYMLWVNILKVSNDSKTFVEELNNKTGLLVCPGIQFGPGGEGHFRINLATSRSNVLLAARKLKEFIKGE